MSCAACSSRVEKAVSKVPGVTSCSVSLLTNSMGVEGTASQSEIIAAVEAAGYGVSVKGADAGAKSKGASMDEDALKDRETPVMKRRLIASLCFLIPLMYISMGHMMWNWPLPGSAWRAEHGYSGSTGIRSILYLQYLCLICNDRCTGEDGHGRRDVLHA